MLFSPKKLLVPILAFCLTCFPEVIKFTHGSYIKKLILAALGFIVTCVLEHFLGITFHQTI